MDHGQKSKKAKENALTSKSLLTAFPIWLTDWIYEVALLQWGHFDICSTTHFCNQLKVCILIIPVGLFCLHHPKHALSDAPVLVCTQDWSKRMICFVGNGELSLHLCMLVHNLLVSPSTYFMVTAIVPLVHPRTALVASFWTLSGFLSRFVTMWRDWVHSRNLTSPGTVLARKAYTAQNHPATTLTTVCPMARCTALDKNKPGTKLSHLGDNKFTFPILKMCMSVHPSS